MSSYLLRYLTISCGWCDVSYVLILALINLFFSPTVFSLSVPPDSRRPTATFSWTTCILSPHHDLPGFFLLPLFVWPSIILISISPSDLKTPLRGSAPFWLEIIECAVAPVAMEDSDHEVQSSSDEHDSCPPSPNHRRDNDADQVLAISHSLPEQST